METRYTVATSGAFDGVAHDVVWHLHRNNIAEVTLTNDKIPNVSISCNIHTGVVSTIEETSTTVKNSYPILTKPIENAISMLAREILASRLHEIADKAMQKQIGKQLSSSFGFFAGREEIVIVIANNHHAIKCLNDVVNVITAANKAVPQQENRQRISGS